MNLETVKGAYEALSGKASEIVRQLSLAGIALIWLFKAGTPSSPILETPLLRAALFIFVALFLDLSQYLVGTFTWYAYYRKKEKENSGPDTEFEAPAWINWPTWLLFWLKAGSMLTAYVVFILPFLIGKFVG